MEISSSPNMKIMKYSTSFRFSSLLFFSFFVLFIAVPFAADGDSSVVVGVGGDECEYTLNVQTGTAGSAGTDAIIRVMHQIFRNGVSWDPAGHNYFEEGDLDIFTLRAPCIPTPLCSMSCRPVTVGPNLLVGIWNTWRSLPHQDHTPPSGQTTLFDFNKWLAVHSPPYQAYQ